jgi:hypothetical protein
MSNRLSASKLVEIFTEICPKAGSKNHHYFQAEDIDDLEVKCGWCGLKLNLCSYTYDQVAAPATTALPDESASKWPTAKFLENDCFKLPFKSGYIASSLFWYTVDLAREYQVKHETVEYADGSLMKILGLNLLGQGRNDLRGIIRYFDCESNVKTIFACHEYERHPIWGTIEEQFQYWLRVSAEENLDQLVKRKGKRNEPDLVAEIEHQLSLIPPDSEQRTWRGRPRAVFAKFEAWRQAQQMGGVNIPASGDRGRCRGSARGPFVLPALDCYMVASANGAHKGSFLSSLSYYV